MYFLLIAAVSAAFGTPEFKDCSVKFFWTTDAQKIELQGSDGKFHHLKQCETENYESCTVSLSRLAAAPFNLY